MVALVVGREDFEGVENLGEFLRRSGHERAPEVRDCPKRLRDRGRISLLRASRLNAVDLALSQTLCCGQFLDPP
jgi:hypothetical protein